MRNWQIALWLVLFFPVGLYFMFMHSDWKKPVKYGLTGLFILALFIGGVELWSNLFYLGSFFAMIIGLFTVFRKKSRRNGLATLALGVLVFAVSSPLIDEQIAERELQKQLVIEAEAEAERLAEEERLEEIARQEEQKRLEEEKKLKKEITAAIEHVEKYPTRANYDKAVKLLDELETKDRQLSDRLAESLPEVEAYDELLASAEEAVEKAQMDKDRATYDDALELVEALPVSSRTLTRRLDKLDEEITKVEEVEKLAAEKAAEEERKAVEAAQKKAEEERVAAEQEAQRQAEVAAASASQPSGGGSSNSSSSNTTQAPVAVVAPPVQTDNIETTVYIAPQSGTKYHYSANCRGLNNANSIQEMSLSQAKNQGYDLCGWEK